MASVHSFGNRIKSDDDAICSRPLPGRDPHAYAIFVDERDIVWLSEWSANALVRFDRRSCKFDVLALPRAHANVRQMMGRPGEVRLSESGTDHLLRYRYRVGSANTQ